VPPAPRYAFSKCCSDSSHAPNVGDPDHASDTVKKYEHVRSILKSELVRKDLIKNFWIMDTLSILGDAKVSLDEKLEGLRRTLSSDGVHFTDLGYHNWISQMSVSMSKVLDRADILKRKEDAAVVISGGNHQWRGFTSPVGSIRRPSSGYGAQGRGARGRGRDGRGGGGRGRVGHGGKPYDHFGQRRF